MVDVSGDLLGLGYLCTGVAALVTALRNGRRLKATNAKVDHVSQQVTTSNGKTLAAIVEGNEAEHVAQLASDDLVRSDGHLRRGWWSGVIGDGHD